MHQNLRGEKKKKTPNFQTRSHLLLN
jgi:hypothetical protein